MLEAWLPNGSGTNLPGLGARKNGNVLSLT